jgi:hypothetical protein
MNFKRCRVCKDMSPIHEGYVNAHLALHLADTHGLFAHYDKVTKYEKLTKFILSEWSEELNGFKE